MHPSYFSQLRDSVSTYILDHSNETIFIKNMFYLQIYANLRHFCANMYFFKKKCSNYNQTFFVHDSVRRNGMMQFCFDN